MRDHVASISDDEHITYISLSESGWQHSTVHTRHEHCGGVGIVSDSLEVLEHVSLPVSPVPHDTMENGLNTTLRHDHCLISGRKICLLKTFFTNTN